VILFRILFCLLGITLAAGSLAYPDTSPSPPSTGPGLSQQQLDQLFQIQAKYQKEIHDLLVKTIEKLRAQEAKTIQGLQDKIMKLQVKETTEIEKLLAKDEMANLKNLLHQEQQQLKGLQQQLKELEKQLQKAYSEQIKKIQEQAKMMEMQLSKAQKGHIKKLHEQELKKTKK
jgi:hypothetical protein